MALRSQRVPPELADAAVMRYMGWGWQDLMAAPAQLVEDVRTWMSKEAAIGHEQGVLAEAEGRRRGG